MTINTLPQIHPFLLLFAPSIPTIPTPQTQSIPLQKMPLTITRFAPENLSSAEVTKSLTSDRQSASYKLEYFDVSGFGGLPRDILSIGGAQWEDLPITVSFRPLFSLAHLRFHQSLISTNTVPFLFFLLFAMTCRTGRQR